MVNMYVLGVASSPPAGSGWEAVADYNGRYVRFTSSIAQHGVLGGADQHQHLSVATTSGNCGAVGASGSYSGFMSVHNHSIGSTYSGYSNNDPVYYTLSLWRIDLDVWESTHRTLPVDAVLPVTTTISCFGMTRFASADGKLIKLDTPGNTGGRLTHTDHTLTVTLADRTPSTSNSGGGGYSVAINATHGHSATFNSFPSNTVMPRCLATRLYQVVSETDHAPAGIVAFFDGTPSSNWTSTGWDAACLMSDDSDPAYDGSDSHPHSSASTTSSVYTNSQNCGSGTYRPAGSHNHPVDVALQSTDHVPEYVSLCPYYLNTTMSIPSGRPIMW